MNFASINWMKCRLLFFVIVLFGLSFCVCAATPDKTDKTVPVLYVDSYFSKIYHLDPSTSSYNAIVWLTVTTQSKMTHLLDQVEFVEAEKQSRILSYSKKNTDGSRVELAKYYLKLYHHFDMRHSPFDQQVLTVNIEDSRFNAHDVQLRFANSQAKLNAIVDPNALPLGWDLDRVVQKTANHVYMTNFGDLTNKSVNQYSRLSISVYIHHHNLRLFFSMFITLYLAYLLSLFALLIPANIRLFSPSAGLMAGSVFSLVGNFFISSKYLLHTLHFTFIDKLQSATLLLMLLTYLALILSGRLAKDDELAKAVRVRKISFILSVILYVILNYLIFS